MNNAGALSETLVVVNERAGGGAMADVFRRAEHPLRDAIGAFDVAFTDGPGDCTKLVRSGLRAGVRRVIVAGGDGTVNEAVNGFFDGDEPVAPEAALGVLAGGTGGDLRKTLGIPNMEGALDVLRKDVAHGQRRRIDLGRLSWLDDAGTSHIRRFINITSIGLGGLVDTYVGQLSRFLPGKLAYAAASARALATWSNPTYSVRIDDGEPMSVRAATIAICNGRYFGGGMMIAPGAELDDGAFDIVMTRNYSRLDVLRLSRVVYTGAHLADPRVTVTRARSFTADCSERVVLDVDGEPLGRLPARFDIQPAALDVIAP